MPIFAVALFTAFLTAFYVIRMLVIAFFGNPRSDSARESRESPPVMTLPVMVLAVLAAVGGFGFFARRFLALPVEKHIATFVPALAVIALIAGSVLAVVVYRHRETAPVALELFRHTHYVDVVFCCRRQRPQ